ncbi:glycosyl transferase, partial [Amycolatopsis lurida]
MRVLLTTYPEKTIFQPMVPLAWALRTAGHEVRVASQPRFNETITDTGLTAAPVGRHNTNWRRLTDLDPDGAEEERSGLPMPYHAVELPEAELDWQAMSAGYRTMLELWHRRDNFPLIAGLTEFARHWQPDLVLWEPTTYAGAIAAKACGAAHARLLWSIDVFGVTRDLFLRLKNRQPPAERADPLADWLGAYGRKYGFDFTEDMVTGQFTVDPLPATLRMEADLHYLPVQYLPYGGPAVVPDWSHEPPDRPRVGLTLGTSATEQFAGYGLDVGDILRSLADLDVEVVATVAESEQRK